MTRKGVIGWLYWGLMGSLAALAALGVAREYRASGLVAPISEGIPDDRRLAYALEIAARVADRFRFIEDHGPLGEPAAWPLRTDADKLLTGGDCGQAAGALGAVFISRGRPFRIIQINVGQEGAGHIMLETKDDEQRWVLIDPLDGHGFPGPEDGRYLGIDEIRAFPVEQRGWLAEEYRSGQESLFGPYRRTNWARLGPLADFVRTLQGDEWMDATSLRAAMLVADRSLAEIAALLVALLVLARMLPALLRRRSGSA